MLDAGRDNQRMMNWEKILNKKVERLERLKRLKG
jgi:hypothetical protein